MNDGIVDTQPSEFEYRGLMAKTWDLFRGDTSDWPDRFFFRDMVRMHGGPVLDVGCGTGRLLLDFMADGVDIDGVDNSPEMLELCHTKAGALGLNPRTYLQSMEALDLPRKYQTIMVPSSSFQLLTDMDVARQAMGRFYDHLLPAGVLVMPFMAIWSEGDPLHSDWAPRGEMVQPDGAMARRWSRVDYDPETQLEHTEDRYELVRDGVVVAAEHHRRSPATRGYTQAQAVALYEEAGFTSLKLYSDFTLEPAKEGDRVFCVEGRRPAG